MKTRLAKAALATGMIWSAAAAAQEKNVKIGVLTDMASVYSHIGGTGSVLATNKRAGRSTSSPRIIRTSPTSRRRLRASGPISTTSMSFPLSTTPAWRSRSNT